jgi:Flp pilus assembly protein TadD
MRYYTRGLKGAINTLRALEPRTEAEYIDRATTRHYLLLQDYQYEEAFGAINETIAYFPENTDLIYARALVAAELNQLETVEHDLRSIIARRPKHANALNALGYTLADQTERYEEAKELIVKALELRPNDAHILDSMGWVLYRMEDFEQAVSYLRRAYDKAPEVEVAAHLGEVLWEKGEADQARSVWVEAFDKDAENPLLNRTLQRYKIDLTKP